MLFLSSQPEPDLVSFISFFFSLLQNTSHGINKTLTQSSVLEYIATVIVMLSKCVKKEKKKMIFSDNMIIYIGSIR